jgi:catechol 2,3-dioxygenase-like lactoylglutathione lyase family enzyme
MERLRGAGIKITVGPAPRTGALGPMTSIYCEDPDRNLVEIATYAKG